MNGNDSAFPVDVRDFQPLTGQQVVRESHYGLTKREYAAIKAMQGLLTAETEESHYESPEKLAKAAVRQADALLSVLSSPPAHPGEPA